MQGTKKLKAIFSNVLVSDSDRNSQYAAHQARKAMKTIGKRASRIVMFKKMLTASKHGSILYEIEYATLFKVERCAVF